jgi:BlaI family transcriptional regulator, penicillinase repressor
MPDVTISDAEWQVMQVLWRLGQGTAADVIAELSATAWSHRTIRTMLARLTDKGALAATPDGHRYLYRPQVTRQKCVRSESRSFLRKVFAGDAAELLVHFVQDTRMTPEQIDELKRLLEAKRPEK